MSHFIEANIYWIVAIVNLIPVLLLVLFVTFGKIRSNNIYQECVWLYCTVSCVGISRFIY